MMIPKGLLLTACTCAIYFISVSKGYAQIEWLIDSTQEWDEAKAESVGLSFKDDLAILDEESGTYRSTLRIFNEKRKLTALTLTQSPSWLNWQQSKNIGPANLRDAPVALRLGPNDYWMFGRHRANAKGFESQEVKLEGFEVPLKTTSYKSVFDAPGGLSEKKGGYHAWQSRDLTNWVHHGPVTEAEHKWATTAEHVDGNTLIYFDFPNDQDPHLYIDNDLTDGKPGEMMGRVFQDPSHGSDVAVIRDRDGQFHMIYEDWSPINARKHSWDSPLAGRAVSPDGIQAFSIRGPAVDERTTPTGEIGTFTHPHWTKEAPKNFKSDVAEYEIHEPEQDAYGDWAAIVIGEQYYLFGDFHPAGKGTEDMQTAWFTANRIDETFRFQGSIGQGHPDPDILFAEGKFYLITQQKKDWWSSGPWIDAVNVRVGVDTSGDGLINEWTAWQQVSETYTATSGFAKVFDRQPAQLNADQLAAGYQFCFEIKIENKPGNAAKPMIDTVRLQFN